MTYSVDFRRRVLEIKMKENLTCDETSKRFGIGINSVVRWSKKLEPQRTRNKPATKINMEALKRDIGSYPDAYSRPYIIWLYFMILKQGFDGAADTSSHRFGLSPFFLDGVKIRRIRRKIKQYVPCFC